MKIKKNKTLEKALVDIENDSVYYINANGSETKISYFEPSETCVVFKSNKP